MAEQFVTVHRRDPQDPEILAVIRPPRTITGTDDPDLIRKIRDAIDYPGGAAYDPRKGGTHPGPAHAYPADSLDWLVAFLGGPELHRATGSRGRVYLAETSEDTAWCHPLDHYDNEDPRP